VFTDNKRIRNHHREEHNDEEIPAERQIHGAYTTLD